MLKSIYDMLQIIENYYDYLNEKNVKFNANGFPFFSENMFLKEWPELIVPYDHRNNKCIIKKSETLICFFTRDVRIYPRIEKLFEEIDIYKEYAGVIAPDITVTSDMDIEQQRIIILVNQLFLMILAVNGVKIVANLRIGNTMSLDCTDSIPRNVMCASGFLGCDREMNYDMTYISKIMRVRPSKLLLYGKHDRSVEEKLLQMGFEFKVYEDFHKLSKRGR